MICELPWSMLTLTPHGTTMIMGASREVEMDLASDPAQLEAVPTSTPRSLHVHGQCGRKSWVVRMVRLPRDCDSAHPWKLEDGIAYWSLEVTA